MSEVLQQSVLKLKEQWGNGGVPTRKRPDKPKYDAAMVALLAAKHVPLAIRTIAELVKKADRDSVRLRAATTMVELACGLEASEEAQGTTVYVIATAPEQQAGVVDTAALAEEVRRRIADGSKP